MANPEKSTAHHGKRWLTTIGAGGLFALAACGGPGSFFGPPTSQEMLKLRDIERGLDLPDFVRRSEGDRGSFLDDGFEQARHFERQITLEYGSREVLNSIASRLPDKGWQKVIDQPNLELYTNIAAQSCIAALEVTSLDYRSTPAEPFQVYDLTIRDAHDDNCRTYF